LSCLSDQKYWRVTDPLPTPLFFPQLSDRDIEIAILFSIIEITSGKMTPAVLGERPESYEF